LRSLQLSIQLETNFEFLVTEKGGRRRSHDLKAQIEDHFVGHPGWSCCFQLLSALGIGGYSGVALLSDASPVASREPRHLQPLVSGRLRIESVIVPVCFVESLFFHHESICSSLSPFSARRKALSLF
jgi:hypothetical protein